MTDQGPTCRDLASASDRAFGAVPPDVLTSARLHLLDGLAVGVAGAARGPVRGVTALAASGGSGRCTVLGSPTPTAAPVAALANGALIHSLEYDDTHVPSVMHGSSVIAPSAFAAVEESGASGDELLRAFAVGWEFLIRIGLASPGRIQARGFQITSAGGAFASAVVSGLLHGDPTEVVADAIGIAGSQAAGTFAFLEDGATVKSVQPGWAAHSGMLAAELARSGVGGPGSVFGGRYGFYSLYAGDASAPEHLTRQMSDLGSRWHLPEAAFKLVPCCHYIHPFVEALQILLDQGIDPDDVRGIHCHVPDGAVPVIAEGWSERQRPPRAHDARWSLPYVLAMVLRDGHVSVGSFDGASDGGLMTVAETMTFEVWRDCGFPERFPARIDVELSDGSNRTVVVDDVKGGLLRPIEAADVIAKAKANLTGSGMSAEDSEALVRELTEADEPDVTALGRLLRGSIVPDVAVAR